MTTPALFERILDREPELDLQRRVAEAAALQANESDLVVVLPRDVVGRADVNVRVVKPLVELRLHGFGLRNLLRLEPLALQHIEEVGVAGGVELVGPVERHAAVGEQPRERAMNDRRANLALDVVADDWQAGVSKLLRPFGIGRQEHRDAIDHARHPLQGRLARNVSRPARSRPAGSTSSTSAPDLRKAWAMSVGSRSAGRKATSSS